MSEDPQTIATTESSGATQAAPCLALASSSLVRGLWAGLGLLFVALATVGAFLPVLPTTPFLILAAACFARGSRRLHARLMGHKSFGPLIRDYLAGRGLDRRVKYGALLGMWLFVGIALGPGLPEGRTDFRWLVGALALIGTVFLLRIPNLVGKKSA